MSPSIASATDRTSITWRTVARLALMVLALLFLIVPHLLYRAIGRPSPMVMAFLNAVGWIAGLRIKTTGTRLRRDVLFVSNHVSWLDILALGGATGAAFVSRDDVERWPLVGWIAGLNDTIYVARQARREVHGQADRLRRTLARGRAVALFPEGTTEGGHVVLPFRPSLFASLFPPLEQVRVQPVAIDYGEAAEEIAWVGDEPAGANAGRILSRRGTIPVTIRFLEPVDPHQAGERKALAAAARAEVVEALGASEPPPQPLYGPR